MTPLLLTPHPLPTALPTGWHAGTPGPDDVADLHALRARHEVAARGGESASLAATRTEVAGDGADVRSHVLVRDASGAARAWASVHDRAAGRVLVEVVVDPELDDATGDDVAAALFAWADDAGGALARARGLTRTQLDSGAFDADADQQRRLAAAGYRHVRTWWQMRRPVGEDDRGLRPPRPGVRIRRLGSDEDDRPGARDLVTAHAVLERAFTDHFNHHEETFEEFLARLRADPGHRWDHWWLAELVDGDEPLPVGVLLAGASTDADGHAVGSYVEYLGVVRAARGRGVARSLLDAVVTDAVERGRAYVGLEVDADSPTGAADLYVSSGFTTSYVTQSWHRYVDVP